MNYYEVEIVKTGSPLGRGEFSRFDSDTRLFHTLDEVRAFLTEEYGACKRDKAYVDLEDGGSKHVGYVYRFHNADLSHSPVERWYQRDWVTVSEIESSAILL